MSIATLSITTLKAKKRACRELIKLIDKQIVDTKKKCRHSWKVRYLPRKETIYKSGYESFGRVWVHGRNYTVKYDRWIRTCTKCKTKEVTEEYKEKLIPQF